MLLSIDWSRWDGIIGIVATVVFGVWAVALAKRRRYPGQLTFFRQDTIRLVDDITSQLPQITVSYKGQPAGKNLIFWRGFLANTGSKDITKEMIEKPLTIRLPDGCRWLEVSGQSEWGEAEHATITSPQTVELSWRLFRSNEFLRCQGLIEVSEGKTWTAELAMEHRIADTGKVKAEVIPRDRKMVLVNAGFMAVSGVLLSAIAAAQAVSKGSPFVLIEYFLIGPLLLVSLPALVYGILSYRWITKMERLLKTAIGSQ